MDETSYMEGRCHVLAVAVQRNMGGTFLLLCERSQDYRNPKTGTAVPAVHHVYALLSDGRLIDVRGEHVIENVVAQWLSLGDERARNPFTAVEVEDEQALEEFVDDGWNLPLTSYSKADVDGAWEFFVARHRDILLHHGR